MTRKIKNMNSALHPRDSVAKLYLSRKEGGTSLLSVEDCVDQAVLGLENYVSRNEDRILVAGRIGNEIDREGVEDFKKRKKK